MLFALTEEEFTDKIDFNYLSPYDNSKYITMWLKER